MSQFPGGGPDFILPGRPGYKAQKSRGVYLQWLDDRIAVVRTFEDDPPFALEALKEARKAFTDEFYPK